MRIVSFEEFMALTMGGRPNQMDVGPYVGYEFSCACGHLHVFDPSSVAILRELRKMRLVLACPQSDAVTCVKATGILRFKGFESLFGAQTGSKADREVGDQGSIGSQLEMSLHSQIRHADQLACHLWDKLGVDSDIQARHGIGTITAAIATSANRSVSPDMCIDEASRFLGDSDFDIFLHEPDVRHGLQRMAEDARSAAKASDAKTLSGLVQMLRSLPQEAQPPYLPRKPRLLFRPPLQSVPM